jgi:hypothetical protein
MEIDEEIEYVKHLAVCEVCRNRVSDYSVISNLVFFDVEAPDVKDKIYRKVGRSKSIAAFLMISLVLSMILFGSHIVVQNNLETNLILQALNNGNISEDNVASNETGAPEYMETAYSYGNW